MRVSWTTDRCDPNLSLLRASVRAEGCLSFKMLLRAASWITLQAEGFPEVV